MQTAPTLPMARRGLRRRRRAPQSESQMLTGGTRDVKPEILSFVASESANDTTTTVSTALPVLRNFSSGNASRAQIVEVLKVWVHLNSAYSATNGVNVNVAIGSKNNGTTTVTPQAPDVFAWFSYYVNAAATGQSITDRVFSRDLTDGAGNGILVATDNIYTQVSSAGSGATQSVGVKILYRIYGASVIEYVGIVQGQQ